MLLWLEEGVEVPERALHELVGRHFLETHADEDANEFSSHLQQRVKVPLRDELAMCAEVDFLELGLSPLAALEELSGKVCYFLLKNWRVLRALDDLELLDGFFVYKLALFKCRCNILRDSFFVQDLS